MKVETIKTKLPKSVKRITILKASDTGKLDGGVQGVVVPEQHKKRRGKGIARLLERIMRRAAKSSESTAQTYGERHDKSNRKRRDGWLRDLGYNALRASRKGSKVFKLGNLLKK